MSHRATLEVHGDYSPHWSFRCDSGKECEFYNPAHDECNAVVWLENDDATNESLEGEFSAWTGTVELKWNADSDMVSGYYSFKPRPELTTPPLTRVTLDELIEQTWEDTPPHTLQRYGARELRDAILSYYTNDMKES